jgi:hypothetical protein
VRLTALRDREPFIRHQEARRLSLWFQGVPQGLQRDDQERDGKQPYQVERLASGILPDGVVKERH